MTACRRWRRDLVDTAHSAAGSSANPRFAAHLSQCTGCSAELAAQRALLAQLPRMLPDRPHNLQAWQQVGPRLAAPPARGGLALGYPIAAMLAIVLLFAGGLLGELLRGGAGPAPVTPPIARTGPTPGVPLATDRYLKFLEQSAPLLLAITNRETGTLASHRVGFEPQREQRAADQLAAEANALSAALLAAGREQQAALVGELELVFLQIANLSDRSGRAGLELVQATIADRALLFQLTVEELRHLDQPRAAGAQAEDI